MTIEETAEKYNDYLTEIRHHFHKHPELSGKEYNTSKKIKDELDKIGVPWEKCGLETGVLATIKGVKSGKTILLRGDMDALPVDEKTELSYASENAGVMHACGHDCHTAMLLTAAHIINDMKSELCGTVKLAFQPAEEIAKGAEAMISDGAMDNVDGCFGMHVWSDVETGKLSCEAGTRMAACDKFIIRVTGRGGHGSAPHECIDAAIATAAIVSNLQTIVSREVPPSEATVVTVGKVDAGSRWNIISERGQIEGTTRCFDRKVWSELPTMIERIAKDTAAAFKAEAELEYIRLVPPLDNDADMAALVQAASKKVISEDAPYVSPPVTGSEDFAFFQEKAPGAIALLGVRNEACDAVWAQHSEKYKVDESALIHGAMLYAQVAMDYNSNNMG